MRRLFPVLFLLAASCAALAMMGCTPGQPIGAISKAQIAAVEVSVTQAELLAGKCLAVRIGPCGVPATRATIIAAAHDAHDTFKQLQAAPSPTALTAAELALTRLAAAIPATK